MQTIDAVAIIQRLEAFVLGDDADDMTDVQVNAALGLLDRVLPSLVEVEVKLREEPRAKGFGVSTNATPLVDD